jgi:hypothetical protein
VASCINHYPNGDLNINMLPTMEGAEFLALGRAAAMAECRRRVHCHWHFLQTHFPEFRQYRLATIFPLLGIRESLIKYVFEPAAANKAETLAKVKEMRGR